jgi:hypothetical protein
VVERSAVGFIRHLDHGVAIAVEDEIGWHATEVVLSAF